MLLNRALVLAVVATAIPVWAYQQATSSRDGSNTNATAPAVIGAAAEPAANNNGLKPRMPIPKMAHVIKPAGESRLAIKFRDDVKARAQADRTLRATTIERDVIDGIVAQHQLQFKPLTRLAQDKYDILQSRAEAHSGREQPDIAGIMYIEGPEEQLEAAANKLLKLDSVEFVYFQEPWKPAGPANGACCTGNTCTNVVAVEDCDLLGGTFYAGLACSPGFCLPGACCAEDGTCSQSVQGECIAIAGTTFFPGESCFAVECPQQETGSCCTIEDDMPVCDSVTNITAALCQSVNGTFVPGGDCTNDECITGACCLYPDVCAEMSIVDCFDAGGVFRGGACDGGLCDFECGDLDLASCFVVHGYPMCRQEECCELVGDFRPFCVDPDAPGFPPPSWDALCVALANFLCDPPGPPPGPGEPGYDNIADRCFTQFNQPCFIVHSTGGCWQADPNDPLVPTSCCYDVCALDPFCCSSTWDAMCVQMAFELCSPPDSAGPTPDLTQYQGYLRGSRYEAPPDPQQLGGRPPLLFLPPAPPDFIAGFAGQGWDLFAEGPDPFNPTRWSDDSAMVAPERFEGLYGLGRALQETYGVGDGNGARGAGIKIAVIEWAFHGAEPFTDTNSNGEYDIGESFIDHNANGVRDTGHEDLDVIEEPGQTLIMIPSITHPEHATACLGIINAQDNGFGMVGIAPDAQAYFFPLTSIEEGPREAAAFLSCFLEFGPGDVISCSFGPGGSNLNNDPVAWALIKLGTDLGITTVVAAGNDCVNLDDLPGADLGDSGAIVVGAATPGTPYCRLSFSNYYRTAGPFSSQRVHMSAWGEYVASTGYGDVFAGDGDVNRMYTTYFNGTSAATPQVAGLVACLQGLAKQFFGVPLSTPMDPSIGNNIRNVLTSGSFPQCNNALVGFFADADCGPDVVPDEPRNLIGPYPQARAAGNSVLSQWSLTFDQSPLVRDIYLLRGNLLTGNKFSIKATDNNYLVMQSLYTSRNFVPVLTSFSSEANFVASRVKYLATGYTTDLLIEARDSVPQSDLEVIVETQVDRPSIMFLEMYDWSNRRWSFVGFNQLGTTNVGAETSVAHDVPFAQRFRSRLTGNVYLRVYVLVLGNPSVVELGSSQSAPPVGPIVRIDHVNIRPGVNIGEPPIE